MAFCKVYSLVEINVEKSATATNTFDDSTSEADLSKKHEVDRDYLPSAFIPAEVMDSDQEHPAAVSYSNTLLV